MSKHTPGPWSYVGETHGFYVGKPGIRLAAVMGAGGVEEEEANARLIAAAPELLDIVQRFVTTSRGDDWIANLNQLSDLLDDAEIVIAKAKGQEGR